MTSSNYLKITFEEMEEFPNIVETDFLVSPFASSDVYLVPIRNLEEISEGNDVKTVYKLSLNVEGIPITFLPGDTVGIIPTNDHNSVENILQRLNITSLADKRSNFDQTNMKTPLKHIPCRSTLRNVFLHNVDINTPAKKLFLKSLQNSATNPEELKELQVICSPQGSQKYNELVSGTGRTLLGLLNTFPSCKPAVELILQHLPPLQARPYSICSSPLIKNSIEITFFVSYWNDGSKGLCTGWMENLRKSQSKVPFYFRQISSFRLTEQLFNTHVIFIATGTGLSPFRGFLHHKDLFENGSKGKCWLFFGCRYSDRDYLFKAEINDYLEKGVLTKLNASFSRENSDCKYVQDLIAENSSEFYDWVLKQNAFIFICGNAKTVVKDVRIAIVDTIKNEGKLDENEANDYVLQMEKDKRYVIDTWS